MIKNAMKILTICILMFIALIVCFFPYDIYNKFTDNMVITSEEINLLNSQPYAKFITTDFDDSVVYANENDQNLKMLNLKLFNLITINKYLVNLVDTDVIACGNSIGMILKSKGVIIVGFNSVLTSDGNKKPCETSPLMIGDRIVEIENKEINTSEDIDAVLTEEGYDGRALSIIAYRGNEKIECEINPVKDYISSKYKVGLWVREDASGVGTLTYIRKDTNRFGALGHPISEESCNEPLQISGGEIYNCDVVGINKGTKGKTGDIRGLFVAGQNSQGVIDKNIDYGVFGNINDTSELLNASTYDIGGRLSVKPGKAQILACINGRSVEKFDIEIIKTNFQKYSNNKSMVLRVTDKKLLEKTGGIIQGMSGSPIIQNGKIVGAVTHVFVSDPSKGFGIYLDWMIDN